MQTSSFEKTEFDGSGNQDGPPLTTAANEPVSALPDGSGSKGAEPVSSAKPASSRCGPAPDGSGTQGKKKKSSTSSLDRPFPFSARLLGTLLRWCGHLSPQFAAWIAEGRFRSPQRFKQPQREKAWIAKAKPLTFSSKNGPLKGISWGNAQRTVLLVHGWSGRGAQLGAFAQPLVDRDFRVVAFDGPGHGESPGKQTSVSEFADTLLEVAEQLGPLHGIVGHSFGAAAATIALHRGLSLKRAVFVAPPSSPERYLRYFSRQFRLPPALLNALRARLVKRFGVPWEEVDLHRLAPSMRIPLLILHDLEDRDTSPELSKKLARSWPEALHKTTKGLGHTRILRDPRVVETAVQFLGSSPLDQPETFQP